MEKSSEEQVRFNLAALSVDVMHAIMSARDKVTTAEEYEMLYDLENKIEEIFERYDAQLDQTEQERTAEQGDDLSILSKMS